LKTDGPTWGKTTLTMTAGINMVLSKLIQIAEEGRLQTLAIKQMRSCPLIRIRKSKQWSLRTLTIRVSNFLRCIIVSSPSTTMWSNCQNKFRGMARRTLSGRSSNSFPFSKLY